MKLSKETRRKLAPFILPLLIEAAVALCGRVINYLKNLSRREAETTKKA